MYRELKVKSEGKASVFLSARSLQQQTLLLAVL